MALEKVQRTVEVGASIEQAWETVTDVELLTSWIGIVHSVTEKARLEAYTAVLEDRVGPFKMRADLAVSVTVVEQGRTITVAASGRDRAMDSKIAIDARLDLNSEAPSGCEIRVEGSYQVTGRVASMGGGIIRKKGDRVVNDFFTHAVEHLTPTT